MYIEINGRQYELATTLRVAYKVQGQHAHKPYTEIFQGIGEMTLEQQIGIVYAAFQSANPEDAKSITEKAFLDNFLDNYDVSGLMEILGGIIEGIMGKELIDKARMSAETSEGN